MPAWYATAPRWCRIVSIICHDRVVTYRGMIDILPIVNHCAILPGQFLLVSTRFSFDDFGVISISQNYFVVRGSLHLECLRNIWGRHPSSILHLGWICIQSYTKCWEILKVITVEVILIPLIRWLKHPLWVVLLRDTGWRLCVEVVPLNLPLNFTGWATIVLWYLLQDVSHLLSTFTWLKLLFNWL